MYFHCPYSICLPRPFFNELLRHGGGANVSVDTNRCAFTAQYCQPWVRQQENMMLSFPWMVGEVSGLVDSGGFVEPLSFLRCHVYTSNRLANLLRMMSVPFQEVQELPEAIQSMIGYSIHPPFIGHVDGRHPLKAAERLAKLWRQLWWLRVTVMSDCFQTFGICCHWFGKLFFFSKHHADIFDLHEFDRFKWKIPGIWNSLTIGTLPSLPGCLNYICAALWPAFCETLVHQNVSAGASKPLKRKPLPTARGRYRLCGVWSGSLFHWAEKRGCLQFTLSLVLQLWDFWNKHWNLPIQKVSFW